MELTSEQQLQLAMLFAQQDILNQIIKNYNIVLENNKEKLKEPTLESVIIVMKSIVDDINGKQLAIDTSIKQIQNDITARLN
jgi:hypothetical protein